MYGRSRIREVLTVLVPMHLGHVRDGARRAPAAWALAIVATAIVVVVAARSVSTDSFGMDAAVELIVAGLAASLATVEGSMVARRQRLGRRQLH